MRLDSEVLSGTVFPKMAKPKIAAKRLHIVNIIIITLELNSGVGFMTKQQQKLSCVKAPGHLSGLAL